MKHLKITKECPYGAEHNDEAKRAYFFGMRVSEEWSDNAIGHYLAILVVSSGNSLMLVRFAHCAVENIFISSYARCENANLRFASHWQSQCKKLSPPARGGQNFLW